jgi:TetR/AcrR family transcriptional regulator, fatty acid metabolism regulator protein
MTSKYKNASSRAGDKSVDPPGKLKLIAALKYLLDRKDFNSITTAEIAKTAKTNEALIYWHFKDKRGLLHQVLEEYLHEHQALITLELNKINGALEKLKKLIWLSFDIWNKKRIYAKIILIEVRSFPGYFGSNSYMVVHNYSEIVKELLIEGIANGEIRDDIAPSLLRNIVLGGIEHHVLPAIIFNKKISPKTDTETLCKILFDGILRKDKKVKSQRRKKLDKDEVGR